MRKFHDAGMLQTNTAWAIIPHSPGLGSAGLAGPLSWLSIGIRKDFDVVSHFPV